MKKILLSGLLMLAIVSLYGQERWVSFNGGSQGKPELKMIEKSGTRSMTLEIKVPGMFVSDVQQNGSNFQRLTLTEMQTTKEVGRPELPMINEIIGLPENKIAKVTILEEEKTVLDNYLVYPFQTPTKDIKQAKQPEFVYDKAFYAGGFTFPAQNILVEKPGIWRDVRISGFHYVPFSYSSTTKKLEVTSRIKIRIDFESSDTETALNRSKAVKPLYYRMYKSSILNFGMMGLTELLSSADTSVKYLVITNTTALSTIAPLVQWKNQQGYKVEVRTLQAGFSQPQEFKDYIQQLYNDENLEYVLIVGDAYPNGGAGGGANIVPMYWWAPASEDPTYSDSWYTCLDGPDDHYADLAIGRFTYDNLSDLGGQIEKTMAHYFTPDVSTNWAEHSLLVAHMEQYPQKYTQCKEEIRTFTYGLQNPIFQACYGGAGAGNSDIVDYINNTSCGILNYRGHGSQTEFWEWGATGSFTATNVAQLTNANRLFVLFDVCCDNMDIVDFPGDCLCESFMKSPVASVAINGAIIPSYTIPNHDYDKEMYKAVFEEGIYNIGYVTNFANITVLNVHGTLGRSNVRTYLWLGDASLEPWTKQAMTLVVNHDPQLFLGASSMQVTVSGPNGPEEHAMVCISNASGSIYGVAFTDAAGIALVQFPGPVQDPGTAKVTVTQHNYLPYQGNIAVIPQSGPYVVKDTHVINDAAGNNNGMLDYGESILLSLGVRNVGVTVATNVTVSISSTDPYVTITDNTELYGDVNANSSVSVANGFALSVTNNIPNGHMIMFNMTATDGTNIWSSNFALQGHAPILTVGTVTVSDLSGNNNGKIDIGETVDLQISITNTGSADAAAVIGTLLSTDTYITINSVTQTYGAIASGATAIQSYNITASGATPPGHLADFTMNLAANLGISGTGSFNKIIGQIPILIVNFDPNNSSAPAMMTAISSLGLTADLQTSLPANLSQYNTIFICLGIYSSNYILSTAEGDQLAAFLSGGGKVYMEGGDTWAFDTQTAAHLMFNIQGDGDGTSDLGTVIGTVGSFTEGMVFTYGGENNYIDHLIPVNNAFNILQNGTPAYNTGVAFAGTTYKTIGCSHEFGGFTDGSFPSTKQELMHQYLIFFGLMSDVLSANFSSLNSTVCESATASFQDASNGNPTSWNWSFPGGNPSGSTLQNPTVSYANAGTYDVTLIVSNGTVTDTILKPNYIHVVSTLPAPQILSTPVQICQGSPSTYIISTGTTGAGSYTWTLSPPNAGTISGTTLNATIYWNAMFSGAALVTVKANNACGTGPASNPFTIMVSPLPVVTFAQMPAVCANVPSVLLNGGQPAGGYYSGPGVSSLFFFPPNVTPGFNTLVYTYTDAYGCSSSADMVIYVDACTGIQESASSGIQIYPNPSEGKFTLEANGMDEGPLTITMVNTLGEAVREINAVTVKGKLLAEIDGSGLPKGIYLINLLSSKEIQTLKIIIKE